MSSAVMSVEVGVIACDSVDLIVLLLYKGEDRLQDSLSLLELIADISARGNVMTSSRDTGIKCVS